MTTMTSCNQTCLEKLMISAAPSTIHLNTSVGHITISSSGNQSTIGRSTFEIIMWSTILLIILLTSLLGNLLVIVCVRMNHRLREEKANLFIINLSVTDMTSAVVVMGSSLQALAANHWHLGSIWCDIVCGLNYTLIIVSMLTLCFISLDRYMAVIHALHYQIQVTRKKIYLLLAYAWFQGLCFGLAPILARWVEYDYWEIVCAIVWHADNEHTLIYVIVAFILCFLIPGVVLVVAYTKVMKVAKKHNNVYPQSPRPHLPLPPRIDRFISDVTDIRDGQQMPTLANSQNHKGVSLYNGQSANDNTTLTYLDPNRAANGHSNKITPAPDVLPSAPMTNGQSADLTRIHEDNEKQPSLKTEYDVDSQNIKALSAHTELLPENLDNNQCGEMTDGQAAPDQKTQPCDSATTDGRKSSGEYPHHQAVDEKKLTDCMDESIRSVSESTSGVTTDQISPNDGQKASTETFTHNTDSQMTQEIEPQQKEDAEEDLKTNQASLCPLSLTDLGHSVWLAEGNSPEGQPSSSSPFGLGFSCGSQVSHDNDKAEEDNGPSLGTMTRQNTTDHLLARESQQNNDLSIDPSQRQKSWQTSSPQSDSTPAISHQTDSATALTQQTNLTSPLTNQTNLTTALAEHMDVSQQTGSTTNSSKRTDSRTALNPQADAASCGQIQEERGQIQAPTDNSQNRVNRKNYSASSKAVKSLLIIVLAYFICMTPFSVTKLYKVIMSQPGALPGYINLVASIFQYCSSAINPLIYGIFRKDFQRAFIIVIKKMLVRMRIRETVTVGSFTNYSQ